MAFRMSLLAASISLVATSVQAAPASFSLVELSFGESDPYNLVLEGFELTASKAFTEHFFVAGTYGKFNSEVRGFDVDTDVISVRGGYINQATDNFTLYVGPEIIRGEYTFMGNTFSDTGYGGFAGFHNQVTESISINAEALITKLFNETSFAVELTARYYVTPQFSLAASGTQGGYSGYSFRAAYHF
ncbi:MAG: hypothetical protein JJU03_06995 [Idiomarina sp.]|nr:hypothetical protein [Idiomarina sp.]